MLLFLLALAQQLHDVAWFGDLGEIDLGLDLRLRAFFPGGRARAGRKMFADLFCFVSFYGA